MKKRCFSLVAISLAKHGFLLNFQPFFSLSAATSYTYTLCDGFTFTIERKSKAFSLSEVERKKKAKMENTEKGGKRRQKSDADKPLTVDKDELIQDFSI